MASSWIELDAAALKENVTRLASVVSPSMVGLVLKSNAYGHGLREIYEIVAPLQPPYLCVNTLDEGLKLRRYGYSGRLLVLSAIAAEEFAAACAGDIEVFLCNGESLLEWLNSPEKPKVHLKFNTGLNRQGFPPSQGEEIAQQLDEWRPFVVGLCSHFANVEDVTNSVYAQLQLGRMQQIHAIFEGYGYRLATHIASSAAALLLPESRGDMTRIGLALYGLWPSELTRMSYRLAGGDDQLLQPVLSWRARVSNVLTIAAGEYVGYGCSFKSSRSMRLALIPVGYYEGYPRLAGEQKGSYAIIRGQRCPLVGRVCMNMLLVDASALDGLMRGEVATLIGRDGSERVQAEDLARWGQTINYEIVTRLCQDLPRRMRRMTPP